ncbi:uracil-DNA glycosylase [Rhizobium sp. YJ-22]|uniref:uracil-DNA glycosylase n=1 Tax=Rhizobium sp. YJ-22 TaxID=3037556 RepID=UPI002412AF5C|nr:uracil-DNA glycosylase [Rhizobium sp. YJ-22]MDG3574823.1 uracil-DNA glycosylase [Rhizobium sp. YJ-22]
MTSAATLSAGELAALLHFYADAGVDALLEPEAVDRFAEFEAMRASRQAAVRSAPRAETTASEAATPARNAGNRQPPAPRAAAAPPPAIPDDQAVAQARFAAESAGTLEELRSALTTFTGCNLKNSARSTVFASGEATSGLMVIGPMPNADDDREGLPFSGRAGQMLDRMLGAIGLSRETVLLTNILPWRPPGNRMPSQPEMDICRPFIERQIALAAPKSVLILGNFTARFFFGTGETIHALRGEWREISAGDRVLPALATLHPVDLMAAPINKRLAWTDLLAFKAGRGQSSA